MSTITPLLTKAQIEEMEREAKEKAARQQMAMEFDQALTDPVTRYLTQGLLPPPGELLTAFHDLKYSKFWYYADKCPLMHDGEGNYWLQGFDVERDKKGMNVIGPDGIPVLLPDPRDKWVQKLLPFIYGLHSNIGIFSPRPRILSDMWDESMEEHHHSWPWFGKRKRKKKEKSVFERIFGKRRE
ncbi:MAG: hypothetical protein HWN68_16515, partial [Desulfobacterales bacterium]|nr:hypothetical protein [Desulfobacterales bacterium]